MKCSQIPPVALIAHNNSPGHTGNPLKPGAAPAALSRPLRRSLEVPRLQRQIDDRLHRRVPALRFVSSRRNLDPGTRTSASSDSVLREEYPLPKSSISTTNPESRSLSTTARSLLSPIYVRLCNLKMQILRLQSISFNQFAKLLGRSP